MGRQHGQLKGGLAALAVLVLDGCSAIGEGPSHEAPDNKTSASAGAPGGEAAESGTLPGVLTAE